MWTASGPLALHALHALHLTVGFAEVDVGVHVRSLDLMDFLEREKCKTGCFKSGCKFTGTKVRLECSAESSSNFQPLPQPFTFRIDCRGAKGNFQNLTLYGFGQTCGRLAYKKYYKKNGNNSGHLPIPTTPSMPLISDRIVTLEKDDVMDLQCVLMPFDIPFPHWQSPNTGTNFWDVSFIFIEDGLIQSEKTQIFIDFGLSSPLSIRLSCAVAVEKTYEWTMELWESINYTHFLRLKSPTLGLLEPPKLDLETQQGEIFQVDKYFLKVSVLEATSDWLFHQPSERLVKLDETFYSSSIGPNGSFAVDLKLEVNPDALPLDAENVNVTLQVTFPKKMDPTVFSVMIPVNNTGVPAEGESYPMVILFMVFLMLIFLVAAVGYVYWGEVAQSFFFPTVPTSSERHRSSIELRRI